jgi:NAD(P)-dependent dehydrogenase (short-subunit alcohol dehydrogenase family)
MARKGLTNLLLKETVTPTEKESEMPELDGKVAIVTGAASGLGKATAEVLAADGAAVVVADIDRSGAEMIAKELVARGHRAIGVGVDVAVEDQVSDLVVTAIKAFGRLDILHNNAALTSVDVIGRDIGWIELDPSLFERVLRVNLIGYALGAKYAIPRMISQGGGVVINTSSTEAILSSLVRSMYGASKGGINALTRSIATQYGRQGIRAVGVSPGVIITEGARESVPAEELVNLNKHNLTTREGRPEDVANLVSFLSSDKAGFITGITIQVDGGFTAHFPTYADEVAALTGG